MYQIMSRLFGGVSVAVLALALLAAPGRTARADDPEPGVDTGLNGPPGAPGCPFNNFARPCDVMCTQAAVPCGLYPNLCKVNNQCTTCTCKAWTYPVGIVCECQ